MIKLNSLKQKYESFIPEILLLVLSLFLFLTLGLFSLTSWQSSNDKLVEARLKLSGLTARKAVLDQLAPQITTLTNNKLVIDGVLPTDPSIPVVMDQVQQIALESGVSLTSLQFASKSDTASTISMQAAASGSYSTILTFLRNLENAGRLLFVNSLRFTTSAVSGVDTVSITLDLGSPYFKQVQSGELDASKLASPEFTNLMNKLRLFRIYTPRGGDSSTGKANPFSQ